MFEILKTRWQQKYRTMSYPKGPAPELPARFAGRPVLAAGVCAADCARCAAVCPTGALGAVADGTPQLDVGKCLFCRACQNACPKKVVQFTRDHQLAAARREDLIVRPMVPPPGGRATCCPRNEKDEPGLREQQVARPMATAAPVPPAARNELAAKLYRRSLKLRQVSAGGCNACEADCNVLGTLAWDMGRFGIQFVASPRHADGLLITGPVSENMRLALEKTYAAVPGPKIVIAVGACAISGGTYIDHPEQHNGAASTLPVDLYIPGCPPHPLTILDGLLRFLGRL